MTNEEYFEYMDKPLSDEEKKVLIDAGWEFQGENYIFIPDDYDGCFASGIRQLRRTLLAKQYPSIYFICNGRCKEVLEKLSNVH